jgi:hypothetical protein
LVKCPEDSLVKRGLADLGGNLIYVRPDYRNHVSSLFLEIFHAHETPHKNGLEVYYLAPRAAMADLTDLLRWPGFSSGTPPEISRVQIRTRIALATFLHKFFLRHRG